MRIFAATIWAVVAACRSPSVPDAAAIVDSGQPLIANWASPQRPPFSARVLCAIPDGGVRVSAFGAFSEFDSDCELSPLNCTGLSARDSILSRLDGGLPFPTPHHVVNSDADGYFRIPFENRGLLVFECADDSYFYSSAGVVIRDEPTQRLQLTRHQRKFDTDAGLLVVNPWTRRVAFIDGAKWREQPEALVGFSWATSLDDAKQILSPSDDTPWGPSRGFENMFAETELSSPPVVSPNLSVRLVFDGEPRAPALIVLDDAFPAHVTSNGLDLSVDAGSYRLRVHMPGAVSTEQRVEVGESRREVVVRLVPAPCANARVVDARGNPVAGAKVRVNGRLFGPSEADGRYAFTGLETSSPCTMTASHLMFGVSDEVPAPGPVTLTLRPLHDARLWLDTPNGNVVHGVLRAYLPKPKVFWTGAYDEAPFDNGDLSLAGLRPGPHTLLVLTAEYEAASLEFDTTIPRVTTTLVPRPTVQGVVRRGGAPVEGVRVTHKRGPIWAFSEDEAVTDAEGRFTLSRSLRGDAELSVGGKTVKVKFPSTKVLTVDLQP